MESVQLEDFINTYPTLHAGFQTEITAKREFNELASPVAPEPTPEAGKYYKHQLFTHRFLRIYDRLLIISEPGTGKTCEVTGFLEYIVDQVQAKRQGKPSDERVDHFRRYYIIVSGETQQEEFRKQLLYRCSNGRYIPSVEKERGAQGEQTAITRAIKKFGYRVTTYTTFVRKLIKKYPDTAEGNLALTRDYSDCFFWIDEGHNLRSDPEVTNERERTLIYNTFWRLFHYIQRSKEIITTATPMINTVRELTPLLNLILPADEVWPLDFDATLASDVELRTFFPDLDPAEVRAKGTTDAGRDELAPFFRGQIPDDFDFDNATLAEVEPYFRGRISYIRARNVGAVPIERGNVIPFEANIGGREVTIRMVLQTSTMSTFQDRSYSSSWNDQQGTSFFIAEQQAANFVFPDGTWGKGVTEARAQPRTLLDRNQSTDPDGDLDDELILDAEEEVIEDEDEAIDEAKLAMLLRSRGTKGYYQYVREVEGRFVATPEFRTAISTIEGIEKLSIKYATIIRLIQSQPRASAFVYFKFVRGSGAVVFGLCLEAMGFEKYDESMSPFTRDGQIRPDLRPKPRYALLIGGMAKTKLKSALDLMNSSANAHGDYIRVLIVSRVGRDGINVHNIQQVHIVSGEWNPASLYQAIYRSIRVTSHDDLLREEEERLRKAGQDPSQARIDINIYKHSALPIAYPDIPSIDIMMHQQSEVKDRSIRRVMRMLKQSAIGCQVHYDRNILPPEFDYTTACDYDMCAYVCVDPAPEAIDYSTYDTYYLAELSAELTVTMVNLFRQRSRFRLEELQALLPNYDLKYIVIGLEQIISSQRLITDRWGTPCYVREENGFFYLSRTLPEFRALGALGSYYTENLIAQEQYLLNQVAHQADPDAYDKFLQELDNDPTQVRMVLDSRSIDDRIRILEEAVLDTVKQQHVTIAQAVLDYFSNLLFRMREPAQELADRDANSNLPKKGRKAETKVNDVRNRKYNLVEALTINQNNNTGQEVYLHVVDVLRPRSQAKYDIVDRINKAEGETRILYVSKPEDGWRTLVDWEQKIYNKYLQAENTRRTEALKARATQLQLTRDGSIIYGSLINGQFRIIDKSTEKADAATNAKNVNTGRRCDIYTEPQLLDIMWRLQCRTPFTAARRGRAQPSTEDKIQFILRSKNALDAQEVQQWPFERIEFYYAWLNNKKLKRFDMCRVVYDKLLENELVVIY